MPQRRSLNSATPDRRHFHVYLEWHQAVDWETTDEIVFNYESISIRRDTNKTNTKQTAKQDKQRPRKITLRPRVDLNWHLTVNCESTAAGKGRKKPRGGTVQASLEGGHFYVFMKKKGRRGVKHRA